MKWKLGILAGVVIVVGIGIYLWQDAKVSCDKKRGENYLAWEEKIKKIPQAALDKIGWQRKQTWCGVFLTDKDYDNYGFETDNHLVIETVADYPKEKVKEILEKENLEWVAEMGNNKYLATVNEEQLGDDAVMAASRLAGKYEVIKKIAPQPVYNLQELTFDGPRRSWLEIIWDRLQTTRAEKKKTNPTTSNRRYMPLLDEMVDLENRDLSNYLLLIRKVKANDLAVSGYWMGRVDKEGKSGDVIIDFYSLSQNKQYRFSSYNRDYQMTTSEINKNTPGVPIEKLINSGELIQQAIKQNKNCPGTLELIYGNDEKALAKGEVVVGCATGPWMANLEPVGK